MLSSRKPEVGNLIGNFVSAMSGSPKISVSPPVDSGESRGAVSGCVFGSTEFDVGAHVTGMVEATASLEGWCGLGHHLGGASPAKRLRVASHGADCHVGRAEVDEELEDTDSDTEPVACRFWICLRKGHKSDMSLSAPANSSSSVKKGSSCTFEVTSSIARSPTKSPGMSFAKSPAKSLVKPCKRPMRVRPGGRTFPGALTLLGKYLLA